MKLIATRHIPLLVLNENTLLTYHHGLICRMDINTGKYKRICSLPIGSIGRKLSKFRVLERLLRNEVRTAVSISDTEVLVAYNGAVYHINLGNHEITKEFTFQNGMRGPLGFVKIKGIDGFDDCIAFGEYIPNFDRLHDISIYTRPLTEANWKEAYVFPAGKVRHIHNINVDDELKKVFVLTGDSDVESGIWEAKNNFSEVVPVATGSQEYRCVHIFTNGSELYYASDAPQYQNYIYRLTLGHELKTSRVAWICGSCIYAAETQNYYLFASTVEPDENLKGWRWYLSTKPGPGITGKNVEIVSVDKKNSKINTAASFKKDSLPYVLFQYGNVSMLPIEGTDEVVIYPMGVKKYDGNIYKKNVASE